MNRKRLLNRVTKKIAERVKVMQFKKPNINIKESINNLKAKDVFNQNKRKKILILMSDTGGGHRASAQAIDQALHEQFGNKVEVDIMDIWTDHANYPFNRFVPTYRFLAKYPALWRGFFAYGQFGPTKLFTEIWSKMNSYGSFRDAIVSANPDFIVSVHPLCQLMPISIMNEMNKKRDPQKPKIQFATVVTDLGGAHSTWFDRRADAIFVPSEVIKKLATRNGIKSDKLIMRGLPIRPSFWKDSSKSKDEIRSELGIQKQSKTVLLMGGGDGVGGLKEITKEIANTLNKRSQKSEVVVICGHNKKVSDQLSATIWPENVKVHVKGFCNNIDEYMSASDCLVTKAGPGTIAEAMIRGLPMVLSSFLPGQEAGNVPYVTEGGFGVYTGNNPKKIADQVYKLFQNDVLLNEMSTKARSLSRKDATKLIAKDIGEMCLNSRQNVLSP
jgi:1,2-diacylglycerol 3-beta-galactosyltransferase